MLNPATVSVTVILTARRPPLTNHMRTVGRRDAPSVCPPFIDRYGNRPGCRPSLTVLGQVEDYHRSRWQ
jgi:hypothetical protein